MYGRQLQTVSKKCPTCGRVGHTAEKCWQCTQCGKFGHTTDRCLDCKLCGKFGHKQADCWKCTACNAYGHTVDRCTKLLKCTYCEETGHRTSDCPLKPCIYCRGKHVSRTCESRDYIKCIVCNERGHYECCNDCGRYGHIAGSSFCRA